MNTPAKFLLLLLGFVAPALSTEAAVVFGGFDGARGGTYNPMIGAGCSDFRAHITNTFPEVTFTSANTLTSEYLDAVDALLISAVAYDIVPITPLAPSEQTALVNFVLGGGCVLVFADNSGQFEPASDSMVSPFGLDAGGTIFGGATVTVTNSSHPVASGPFGNVAPYDVSFPGWFPSLGTNAVGIATLAVNGEAAMAAIAPGALSSTSGGAVFFSDSTLNDGNYNGSVVSLIDNALAFVTSGVLGPRPRLFIDRTDTTSVLVFWATNFVGFRLQQRTNVASGDWADVTLTGPNQAELPATESQSYFRLIRP